VSEQKKTWVSAAVIFLCLTFVVGAAVYYAVY
jgi:hypothetical protein